MSLVKRQLLQWETTLAAAVVTLFLVSAATVPGFASSINLSLAAAGVSEVALMVGSSERLHSPVPTLRPVVTLPRRTNRSKRTVQSDDAKHSNSSDTVAGMGAA